MVKLEVITWTNSQVCIKERTRECMREHTERTWGDAQGTHGEHPRERLQKRGREGIGRHGGTRNRIHYRTYGGTKFEGIGEETGNE